MSAMPELAEAIEQRALEWTKAVDVARVATPRSAAAWVGKAKTSSRTELRREIQRARTARVEVPNLLEPPPPVLETMSDVRVRMDAVQLERYERALAQLRQRGQSDIESILAGLELQLANGRVCRQTASVAETLIVLHECPSCEAAHVKTTRGDRALRPTQRAAAHCDATIQQAGKRTRTVKPSVRRQTLERDGYRCSRCNGTRGLQIHHLHERQHGGGHEPSNLRTLCRACHELTHDSPGAGFTRPGELR
jgi:5-methylcytosine-specific restriction endonuclease McrA